MGGRLEGMGGAGWAPFFLAVSSGSRFLVTVTTLRTRWFPPWRIMFTTCRWPTFTTFSLLTCGKMGCGEGAHVGGRDQHPPGAARAQPPDGRTDGRMGGLQADSRRPLWRLQAPCSQPGACCSGRPGRTPSSSRRSGAHCGRPGAKSLATSHVGKARQETSRVPGCSPNTFHFHT